MSGRESAHSAQVRAQSIAWLLALYCCLSAGAVAAQNVLSEKGNIYLQPASGGTRLQLTSNGQDREPSLSPDRGLVVFVRGTPGRTVESPIDEVEATELWLIRANGLEPQLLLSGGAHRQSNGIPVAFFRSPQFSPDGKQIYFLSIAAVVTDTVFAIDVESSKLRKVCPANSLIVVREGAHVGDLIVEQHRYNSSGGSYDWLYLVEPDGTEIDALGDTADPIVQAKVQQILKEPVQ